MEKVYILPAVMISILIIQMTIPLVETLKDMTYKINAYVDCANEMIDYAFMGKVFNFTKCYLEKLNKTEIPKCFEKDGKIICFYKGRKIIVE